MIAKHHCAERVCAFLIILCVRSECRAWKSHNCPRSLTSVGEAGRSSLVVIRLLTCLCKDCQVPTPILPSVFPEQVGHWH